MKGSEWRMRVECLIADIEAVLSYHGKPEDEPERENYTSMDKYMYVKTCTELALAEAKLTVIEKTLEGFKTKHLNRETCDDFDE